MQTANDVPVSRQNGSKLIGNHFKDLSDKPKVSIFIVSFNQKDFIAKAIEGAVNQDYENLEVVISDDGSTDGTADIIEQWQSCYPERLVALLNEDNVGITCNCNRALRACSGDFIAFMGGDDVLLPGKISAQVDWFKQDKDRVLCGHEVIYIYSDGSYISSAKRTKLISGAGPETFINRSEILPPTSTMVRASSIPPHGFDEAIPIASDFLFWIEVLSAGGKFGCVEGVYANRRAHSNSVTVVKRFEVYNDIETTYRIIAKRYPQYRSLCLNLIIKHVTYYKGVIHLELGNKLAAREQFIKTIKEKPLFMKAWLRLLQTL